MFGWRMFHPIVLTLPGRLAYFLIKIKFLLIKKKKKKKLKEMLELNNIESKKMKVRTIKIGGSI